MATDRIGMEVRCFEEGLIDNDQGQGQDVERKYQLGWHLKLIGAEHLLSSFDSIELT